MPMPTREEFAAIAERARLAGRQAALKRYEALSADSNPQNFYGGAYVHLSVDGRSKLGKFFLIAKHASKRNSTRFSLYIRPQ